MVWEGNVADSTCCDFVHHFCPDSVFRTVSELCATRLDVPVRHHLPVSHTICPSPFIQTLEQLLKLAVSLCASDH